MISHWKTWFKKAPAKTPLWKKIIGVGLLIVGFVFLVTPFTPGAAWLIFIGLGFIGVEVVVWDRFKTKFRKKPGEPR